MAKKPQLDPENDALDPEDEEADAEAGVPEDPEDDVLPEEGKGVPLIVEVRRKNPGLARRADAGSPRACIRLFCLCCLGGSRAEVARCTSLNCALWELRHGRGRDKRPEGLYPELPPPKEANPVAMAALAAARDAQRAEQTAAEERPSSPPPAPGAGPALPQPAPLPSLKPAGLPGLKKPG